MKAKSIKGTTSEEIKKALTESKVDGFKPTLAVVFISITNDLDALCHILDQEGIQIFGATSSGEFIDGDISNGGIVVLLMDMKPSHFKILLQDYRDKDPEAVAREMSAIAKGLFKNPSFIVSASINTREESETLVGDPLIKSIESVTGKEVIIWGGRASNDIC